MFFGQERKKLKKKKGDSGNGEGVNDAQELENKVDSSTGLMNEIDNLLKESAGLESRVTEGDMGDCGC